MPSDSCRRISSKVNAAVNELLVARAIQELDPRSRAIQSWISIAASAITCRFARRAGRVTGIEGAPDWSRGARECQLEWPSRTPNFMWRTRQALPDYEWNRQRYDLLLLDPPRVGRARQFLGRIARWRPRRVVVRSCQPSSLARDAGMLVRRAVTRWGGRAS